MSSKKDYHKSVMCNVCGKVVRDNYLKHHLMVKHARTENSAKYDGVQDSTPNADIESLELSVNDGSNDRITVKDNSLTPATETDEVAGDAVDDDANLRFQLIQNNEAYKSNVNLGRQISKVLDEGIIFEESLTKQHKFCLELFRAQQPTTEVANVELRHWQTQLLDVIEQQQMNDQMIIWVMLMGRKGNKGKSWF